jgi:hypothetical protein
MRFEGNYPKESQYSGFETEEECIGHKIKWSDVLGKIEVPKSGFSKEKWEKIIMEKYPLDPSLPKKKWSIDLLNFVSDKLNLDIDSEDLKFYNSLGSPLDEKGVDCFFSFKNPNTKKEAVFTIDLTKNINKPDWKIDDKNPKDWKIKRPKTNHLIIDIKEFPDHRSDPDGYIQKMEEKSETIAKRLIEKTGPTIH